MRGLPFRFRHKPSLHVLLPNCRLLVCRSIKLARNRALSKCLKIGLAVPSLFEYAFHSICEVLLEEAKGILSVFIQHNSLKLQQFFIGKSQDYRLFHNY